MEDRHHELPVVLQHRALSGGEGVGFRPAQADPNAEVARFGRRIDRARIIGYIQPWDSDGPSRSADGHHRVQHRGGMLGLGVASVPARFKPHAIYRGIYFWDLQDLCDLFTHRRAFGHVDGLAPKALSLRQPLRNQVAHDHHGSTE